MKGRLILLLPTLLAGCMAVPKYTQLEPQLEQWEKEQEYGRSLDALGQIDPADPDYAKAATQRKQIERHAAEYEQQIRRETQQKQQEGDWAAALDRYDEALAKYPQSLVIKDGLAKLKQQQRENLDELELQQLLQHGEWLNRAVPIHQDIARVAPRSRDAQNRLARIKAEANEIAQQLAILGNKALADGDLETAEATLPLAQQLSNDPVIEASVTRLQEELRLDEQRRQSSRRRSEARAREAQEKRDQAIRSHKERYEKAFAKQDYLEARSQLSSMEKIDRRYSGLKSMRSSLQQAIDAKVAKLFEAGVSAYSRGQFETAAKNWRTVLQLDPGHQQAKENLERAEKVLQKLERLKEKQGG